MSWRIRQAQGELYWCNFNGWVSRDEAGHYTDIEKRKCELPIGGEWEKVYAVIKMGLYPREGPGIPQDRYYTRERVFVLRTIEDEQGIVPCWVYEKENN